MSGGHFNYQQNIVMDLSEQVARLVQGNTDPDDFGYVRGYSDETLEKFEECAETLARAGEMLRRVDWLVSDDDGEDDFHRRWADEVRDCRCERCKEQSLDDLCATEDYLNEEG